MIVCEFCLHYEAEEKCGLGLRLAKAMSCREFSTGIEKFCSKPEDFVNGGQIIQMAGYFGMKGTELKKVKLMAAREESSRSRLAEAESDGRRVFSGGQN